MGDGRCTYVQAGGVVGGGLHCTALHCTACNPYVAKVGASMTLSQQRIGYCTAWCPSQDGRAHQPVTARQLKAAIRVGRTALCGWDFVVVRIS